MKQTEKQPDMVDYSKRVVQKFTQLCEDGEIMYSDEVKILTYLANKYQPVTVSTYSKLTCKAYKVIQDWIKARKVAYQEIGGVTFILKALN